MLTPRGGWRKSQCGGKASPRCPLYLQGVSKEWCFPLLPAHQPPSLQPPLRDKVPKNLSSSLPHRRTNTEFDFSLKKLFGRHVGQEECQTSPQRPRTLSYQTRSHRDVRLWLQTSIRCHREDTQLCLGREGGEKGAVSYGIRGCREERSWERDQPTTRMKAVKGLLKFLKGNRESK